jgi:hypothetical protein
VTYGDCAPGWNLEIEVELHRFFGRMHFCGGFGCGSLKLEEG